VEGEGKSPLARPKGFHIQRSSTRPRPPLRKKWERSLGRPTKRRKKRFSQWGQPPPKEESGKTIQEVNPSFFTLDKNPPPYFHVCQNGRKENGKDAPLN